MIASEIAREDKDMNDDTEGWKAFALATNKLPLASFERFFTTELQQSKSFNRFARSNVKQSFDGFVEKLKLFAAAFVPGWLRTFATWLCVSGAP